MQLGSLVGRRGFDPALVPSAKLCQRCVRSCCRVITTVSTSCVLSTDCSLSPSCWVDILFHQHWAFEVENTNMETSTVNSVLRSGLVSNPHLMPGLNMCGTLCVQRAKSVSWLFGPSFYLQLITPLLLSRVRLQFCCIMTENTKWQLSAAFSLEWPVFVCLCRCHFTADVIILSVVWALVADHRWTVCVLVVVVDVLNETMAQ